MENKNPGSLKTGSDGTDPNYDAGTRCVRAAGMMMTDSGAPELERSELEDVTEEEDVFAEDASFIRSLEENRSQVRVCNDFLFHK